MFPFITTDILAIAVAALILLVLIMFILLCATRHKLKKINRHAKGGNLAEAITTYYEKIDHAEADIQKQLSYLSYLEKQFKNSIQKVGAIRYNALDDMGSDQSYSLAMLDQYDNGFILTSIYSRDAASVTYLKPIAQAKSTVALSKEEEQALALAQENYQKHMN